MKRIAVCISGQFRSPDWFLDPAGGLQFFRTFGELTWPGEQVEVDYFCCLWETVGVSFNHIVCSLIKSDTPEELRKPEFWENLRLPVSTSQVQELKQILNPKKIKICEDHGQAISKKIWEETGLEWFAGQASQYFIAEQCSNLKQEYEQEQGFIYDLCWKVRFDSRLSYESALGPSFYSSFSRYKHENLLFGQIFTVGPVEDIYNREDKERCRWPFIADTVYGAAGNTFNALKLFSEGPSVFYTLHERLGLPHVAEIESLPAYFSFYKGFGVSTTGLTFRSEICRELENRIFKQYVSEYIDTSIGKGNENTNLI